MITKTKKINIPKALKIAVWNKYIGEEIGKTKCLCCNITDITQLKFHTGHIISEINGGNINIDNLKPICESCNKSMGKKNMNEFMSLLKSEENGNNTFAKIQKNDELTNDELRKCRRIESEFKIISLGYQPQTILTEEDKILYKKYCDNKLLLESNFIDFHQNSINNILPGFSSKNIDNEINEFFEKKYK